MNKKTYIILLQVLIGTAHAVSGNDPKVYFTENKKQWPEQVRYHTSVGNGTSLFLGNNTFTYVKYDTGQLEKIHDKQGLNKSDQLILLHAFEMEFLNANTEIQAEAHGKADFYNNYFSGSDPSRWASNVHSYSELYYKNVYRGVDILFYSEEGNFKYDFILSPGTDPSAIKMNYRGADKLLVENTRLIIKTSVGDVVENIPLAYQLIEGIKKEVLCLYTLSADGNTVEFSFPKGYDPAYTLVIDPVLVAATYSGAPPSTITFGHCAAYDNSGNIYTGGECFNPGFPTTTGAYQSTFAGITDMAISKLNPNGSALLWATYLGGSSAEVPNSLFINNAQEVYVLGYSDSPNYPTSSGCYDNSINGSADIVVSHLNATGTGLVGSTYIGGSADDGFFLNTKLNDHDGLRGEIIVDAAGNACISSYTSSSNFPTTAGCYDNSFNGGLDACVFRLSPTLSVLQWSTFLGGTGDDAAYGLRLNPNSELYVTGFTAGNGFPTTAGAHQTSYQGGTVDGYLAKFNAQGNTLLASTFIGTGDVDISYFIDLDQNANPYVFGVGIGGMPVTAGVYSNPGSANFVRAYNPSLSSLVVSTVFGDGSIIDYYLEPEAFMVDSCNNIYLAGFGGTDVSGYPTTANALYSSPVNGYTCYLMCLSPNATTLLYGSHYYGNHVDGGTSRFDPSGTIYLGICMPPGTPAASWAFGSGTNLTDYDMFVLKMDFELTEVHAIASAAPNDTICPGTAVSFVNSSNGQNYSWNFGDGSPLNTNASPSHTYSAAGSYTVTLIAYSNSTCIPTDTLRLKVVVLPVPSVNLGNDTILCTSPASLQLNAGTATTYSWSTGATSQTIQVTAAGTYWMIAANGVCLASDTIVVQVFTTPSLGKDSILCAGQSLTLNAQTAGATYVWSTGATTPSILVNSSGLYWVSVNSGGCHKQDTVNVDVKPYPVLNLPPSVELCPQTSITLDAGNPGSAYAWSTNQSTQSIQVSAAGVYAVTVSNAHCRTKDTCRVSAIPPISWGEKMTLCNLDALVLDVNIAGASYLWSTGANTPSIAVTEEGMYWVTVHKGNCILHDTIEVEGTLGGGVLWIPNAFTPNNDGLNDTFIPLGDGCTYIHLMIFDRWGELVFETESMDKGWNGFYEGQLSQEGLYVWKVEYKTRCSKESLIAKKGYMSLIR